MSELHRRFIMIQEDNPIHGDVILMWYAVNGMKYPKDTIRKVFNLCVPKDQYESVDKPEILEYLYQASMSKNDPYNIRIKKDDLPEN